MGQVTKPYGDFTNNVDVVDANKINSQINTLYNWANGNVDLSNINPSAFSKTAVGNLLAMRDANANLPVQMPVSGQNPNLFCNPSFRLGLAGWTSPLPTGFSLVFGTGGEGGFLFFNTNSTSAVQVDNTSNLIPVAANTSFTLSGEMSAAGVTAGSISLQWFAFDTNKAAISGGSVYASSGTGWQKYSVSFTTPANTAYLRVACVVNANTTNTAAGWRKIKVEAGSYATTFSDDNTLNTQQYGSVLGLLQVLSGGYKFQSGITGSLNASTNQQVTFPTAFVSSSPIVFVTPLTGNLAYADVTYVSATNFTFFSSSSSSLPYMWIAIGS